MKLYKVFDCEGEAVASFDNSYDCESFIIELFEGDFIDSDKLKQLWEFLSHSQKLDFINSCDYDYYYELGESK